MIEDTLPEQRVLERAYAAFNTRDIDTVLSLMHPDVVWPNGMDGGHMQGRAAVRAYWERQWTEIDPHVEPLHATRDAHGRTILEVRQVVRDMAGAVILQQTVQHIYELREGLIARMDIRPVT